MVINENLPFNPNDGGFKYAVSKNYGIAVLWNLELNADEDIFIKYASRIKWIDA